MRLVLSNLSWVIFFAQFIKMITKPSMIFWKREDFCNVTKQYFWGLYESLQYNCYLFIYLFIILLNSLLFYSCLFSLVTMNQDKLLFTILKFWKACLLFTIQHYSLPVLKPSMNLQQRDEPKVYYDHVVNIWIKG